MTRRTSKEAYERIKREGWLSKKRWEAYDALYRSDGSLTHNELQQFIERENGGLNRLYRNNIVARLGELRDLGTVYETGERKCSISGMTCITWDVTENMPTEMEKVEREVFWAVFDLAPGFWPNHRLFANEHDARAYADKSGGDVIRMKKG